MKKLKMNQYVAAGLVLAGMALAPDLRADVEIFLAGGNASQNIIYDRITNVLSGGVSSVTISPTNSVVRRFVGTVATGQPGAGYGTVTIDVSLLGAVQGLQDVGVNPETLTTGGSQVPTVAVSSTSPQAVDVTSTLTSVGPTLVAPYAFVKKSSLSSDMAGITNLTSRQAVFLENNGGYISSFLLGGADQNDIVYFVGRNLESAVRTEIDANIHHTGTISSWVTNWSGQPVQDPHTSIRPEQRDGGQGAAERDHQHHRHFGGVGHRRLHAAGLRGRAVFDYKRGKRNVSALVLRELLLPRQRPVGGAKHPAKGDYQRAHRGDHQLDLSDHQHALHRKLRALERHAVEARLHRRWREI